MRGLVAQKKTGHFGRTWWGKQVERALEEPYRGQDGVVRHPHVARAKALARNGAILAMEHHGTTVAGEVQGSQLDPFAPTISGTPASTDTIAEVRAAIARHPGSAEQIIADLFPRSSKIFSRSTHMISGVRALVLYLQDTAHIPWHWDIC